MSISDSLMRGNGSTDTTDTVDSEEILAKPAASLDVFGWLKFSHLLSVDSPSLFDRACKYLDDHLGHQTFLLGETPSLADVTVVSAIDKTWTRWISFWKLNKYRNLILMHEMIAAERERSLKYNVDLPGAKVGKVCLRFAFRLSPLFHIEHARVAFWNHYFAKRHKGRLIICFDDANPTEGGKEFAACVLKDIDTLGIKYNAVTYTSDYFVQMIAMAESLIRKGRAYVDDTPQKEINKGMIGGIESKCRSHSLDKNMELWKAMIAGSHIGRGCYLRGKLDMRDPNKYLRDPVYYCCKPDNPHHRTGTMFKLYPLQAFAAPFVDAAEAISHVLRFTQSGEKNALYYRVLEDMEIPKVQIYDFEQLNMAYTVHSIDELFWFVENGLVDGWDDPRLPTVRGLLRRGVTVEAMNQFFFEKGVTRNVNLIEWERLWTINIEKIEARGCPVHTAVLQQKCMLLDLENCGADAMTIPIRRGADKFSKAVTYSKRLWLECNDASSISVGEVISLGDDANAVIEEILVDDDGCVTEFRGVLDNSKSCPKLTKPRSWLPATEENVSVSLFEFDNLITKKKLKTGEKLQDVVNPCMRKETTALGDSGMRNIRRGEIVMLASKGYFICDWPFGSPSMPIVLFAIPWGSGPRNM